MIKAGLHVSVTRSDRECQQEGAIDAQSAIDPIVATSHTLRAARMALHWPVAATCNTIVTKLKAAPGSEEGRSQ